MKTIGVIANCGKPRAKDVLARLGRKARSLGLELLAPAETARLLPGARKVGGRRFFDAIEALVALGGDGTVLRAVRELDGRETPVLGVNIGSLGFLTSVAEEQLERALECLARGNYTTGVRSIAECEAGMGKRTAAYRALNDVVLTNGGSSRVVTLDLTVDGEDVASLVCDGLIISTPTGSTAHSLSAGGPIVLPGSPVFVLTSICAHTLSTRPLVVPERSVIVVRVAGSHGGMQLSVDGQVGCPLREGDRVTVRCSPQRVPFVHLPGYSYFSVLRQKLHWRGSIV